MITLFLNKQTLHSTPTAVGNHCQKKMLFFLIPNRPKVDGHKTLLSRSKRYLYLFFGMYCQMSDLHRVTNAILDNHDSFQRQNLITHKIHTKTQTAPTTKTV